MGPKTFKILFLRNVDKENSLKDGFNRQEPKELVLKSALSEEVVLAFQSNYGAVLSCVPK